MLELSVISAHERRLALPWTRRPEQALAEQLDQLLAAQVRFVSVGHLLAVQRGVADAAETTELALAVEGDSGLLMQVLPLLEQRELPCILLAGIADRQGRAALRPGHAELRALHARGVAIECAGRAEWEQGRVPSEQIFGSMLRARRELERSVGRAPLLYSLATRRPGASFFDLLARAGFELCAGEQGSGSPLLRRSLREHAQPRQRRAGA